MTQPGSVVKGRFLRLNPVACDGFGICAHLAADLITCDEWGYPMLVQRELSPSEEAKAAIAVAACPRKALFISS